MSKKYVSIEAGDTVSRYFKEVRKSIILTPKEEISLARRIKRGDKKAIDKLVKANLKFVVSIAKEYQGQGLLLSDLISEGNYGLIKAATRFDHTKGFRFISYAVWWIRQSIIQSLNDNARIVRLPTNVINKISYLNKEIAKFEFANEREPVYGEIFDKDNEVMNIVKFNKSVSLNDVINNDGDELIEFITSEPESSPSIDNRIKTKLNEALETLDKRERDMLESYFGLNTDCEPMTLEAIGEKYGISKERVRQCNQKSLRILKNNSVDLFNAINE